MTTRTVSQHLAIAVALLAVVPANAQQVTGTLGSPGATSTKSIGRSCRPRT